MLGGVRATFRIFKAERWIRDEWLRITETLKIGTSLTLGGLALRISDSSANKVHALIEVAGEGLSVIDCGSTRGTFLNGTRTTRAMLSPRDTIVVGETRIEISFGSAEEPSADVVSSARAKESLLMVLDGEPAAALIDEYLKVKHDFPGLRAFIDHEHIRIDFLDGSELYRYASGFIAEASGGTARTLAKPNYELGRQAESIAAFEKALDRRRAPKKG